MKRTDTNRNELANSWLVATQTQEWENFETFASLLYQQCSREVPPGRFDGFMAGAENEVRQEACLMLLGKFLASNPNLIEEKEPEKIQTHLVKSVMICIRFAKRRIARKRIYPREIPLKEEILRDTVKHPRIRTYSDLSFDEKRALALSTLELAVLEKCLSHKNANVAKLSLEEGLDPQEIARRLGVSPNAIYQQLTRVVAQLAIIKELVEEEVQ